MTSCIRVTFPVAPLYCNCTILGDRQSQLALIIDPGGDSDRILHEVEELGLSVFGILHTHAHFDHFLASGKIKEATGAPLWLHPADRDLWDILEVQCQMFQVPFAPAPPPDKWFKDGEDIRIGSMSGSVLHTPGHTPGSTSFYFEQEEILFSGDTLFRGGIGRTDLWGGDGQAIEKSIRERLYTLKEETLVIPGHGQESTIGWEREYNMFVKG